MKDFSPGKRRQFGGRNSNGSNNRFERREDDRERKFERHTVTCDSCHQRCEVPFKPTGNKPGSCHQSIANEVCEEWCFLTFHSKQSSSQNVFLLPSNVQFPFFSIRLPSKNSR